MAAPDLTAIGAVPTGPVAGGAPEEEPGQPGAHLVGAQGRGAPADVVDHAERVVEQVQPLGSHFGLYFGRNVTPDNQNHNLRTVIVDPEGRVVEIIIGNRWEPAQVIEGLKRALKPAR